MEALLREVLAEVDTELLGDKGCVSCIPAACGLSPHPQPGLAWDLPAHSPRSALADEDVCVFKCSVSRETECSRVGKQSFIITLGCNSVLIQFATPNGMCPSAPWCPACGTGSPAKAAGAWSLIQSQHPHLPLQTMFPRKSVPGERTSFLPGTLCPRPSGANPFEAS